MSEIRSATEADLSYLATLCAGEPEAVWNAVTLGAEIKNAVNKVWVLERPAHGIVALLVFSQVLDEIEIQYLITHRACRRQGLAQSLLAHLISFARQQKIGRLLLELRQSNVAAKELYTASGFLPYGMRQRYYANGEDAVLMEYSV